MEKSIIENNTMIAEFMGWKFNKHRKAYYIPSGNKYSFKGKTEDLMFHYWWDWLMPVIGKLSNACENPEELDSLKYALLCNDIDTAYACVVDLIKS